MGGGQKHTMLSEVLQKSCAMFAVQYMKKMTKLCALSLKQCTKGREFPFSYSYIYIKLNFNLKCLSEQSEKLCATATLEVPGG